MQDILPPQHGFRGEITRARFVEPDEVVTIPALDLPAMALRSLQYLTNNPDPAHGYQSRFNFYLLWCPPFAPQAYESGVRQQLRAEGRHIDPIAIGDTESRNDIAFNQMREMTGATTGEDVRDIIHQRLVGYLKPGEREAGEGMSWCIPTCLADSAEPIVMEWTTCKLLQSEVDLWRLTHDEAHLALAQRIFAGLRRYAQWDTGRAYYLHGVSPTGYRGCYPHVLPPVVSYWEASGDPAALEFACAMAEGMLQDVQPGHFHHAGGKLGGHNHVQAHAVRGMAQLGAHLRDHRYLQWAEEIYRFYAERQLDTGWLPEIAWLDDHRNHAETCLTADIMEMECWLALGGNPSYWDRVERTIRNYLAPLQWQVTPEYEALYRRIHAHRAAEEVKAGLDMARRLEGGFLSGPTPNDRIFEVPTGAHHHGSVDFQGSRIVMDMMGCCPPEGMRMLYLAWKHGVSRDGGAINVNLAFNHDGPLATVRAASANTGTLSVTATIAATYRLRPPAWAPRQRVRAYVDGREVTANWGGPALAYVVFTALTPGQTVMLSWPVVTFQQQVTEHYLDPVQNNELGETRDGASYRFEWVGNAVRDVEPRGRWLPLFAGKQ